MSSFEIVPAENHGPLRTCTTAGASPCEVTVEFLNPVTGLDLTPEEKKALAAFMRRL
jgi:hypothetical protein